MVIHARTEDTPWPRLFFVCAMLDMPNGPRLGVRIVYIVSITLRD